MMDDSKQTNEDNASIYMSFTDDTMMSTNTAYNTIESANEFSMDDVMTDLLEEANKTLEAENAGTDKENVNGDRLSPLRPFDKNLLNQFNGKCSTPSKDQISRIKKTSLTVKDIEVLYMNQGTDGNKENTRPDLFGDGTHLSGSSMIDSVSSKTLITSNTTDDESCSEDVKDNVKNQTEINKKSRKVKTLKDFSDLEAEFNDKIKKSKATFIPKTYGIEQKDNPEDIKMLIDDMLKLTTGKEKKPKTSKAATTPYVQVRSSLLPIAGGEKRTYAGGLKQRMSVVVKTTLNSPARKMANKVGAPSQRRSVMPPTKPSTVGYRPSFLPTAKPSISCGFGANRNSTQSSVISNKAASKAKLTASYNCSTCGVMFRVKSLLDAHKRSHEVDENPPGFARKTLSNNFNAGGNPQSNGGNQCKYCDKKFALERALHIHLLQNCTKIPPSEQRKLEYTELDHVEKAQLPVFPCTTAGLDALANVDEKDLIEYSGDKVRMDHILEPVKTKMMPPPQASSAKKPRQKAAPHAGVIRTPTKSVPCHVCKQSFKSILDYTNHSLTMHSTNPKTMLAKHEGAPSAANFTKK